ncbi:hypothetical protein CVT24_006548 [Panaeolus cyanescens]|uniref:Uncharacterized protein n=1 Tax=Panaeolus cyanescens TaxID=181874 RepID=A0A409YXC5_9AGAR|nr:hypothetical protein CVT24_006548 [Panaeolus cyanescens]
MSSQRAQICLTTVFRSQLTFEQITALYNFGKFQYSYCKVPLIIPTTSASSPPTTTSTPTPSGVNSLAISSLVAGLDPTSLNPLLAGSSSSTSNTPREGQLRWTFLAPTYVNTIQTSCPWILRYNTAAAVLSRKAAVSPMAIGSAPLSSREERDQGGRQGRPD